MNIIAADSVTPRLINRGALAGSRVGDKPPAAQNATLPQGAGLIKPRAAESKRTL